MVRCAGMPRNRNSIATLDIIEKSLILIKTDIGMELSAVLVVVTEQYQIRAPVIVESTLVALNKKLLQLNLRGRLQFDPPITHLKFLSI